MPHTVLTTIHTQHVIRKDNLALHMITQPPSLNPPCDVVVMAAVLQMSSNTSCTSSPVTAEHSKYLSHLISCETLYASCGYMMPFGSFTDLKSRFSPRTMTGISSSIAKVLIISFIHLRWDVRKRENLEYKQDATYCSLHINEAQSIGYVIAQNDDVRTKKLPILRTGGVVKLKAI